MKLNSILPALVLLLNGCSDTVRTEYATRDVARARGAFERGWLPPALPEGTMRIVEENDLDSNTGRGAFAYPAESSVPYIEMMRTGLHATVAKGAAGIDILLTNETSQWNIHLEPEKGRGEYRVSMLKKLGEPARSGR